MPVVTVDWLDGRTPEQKQALVAGITQLIHSIGGSPAENVNVVLHDVPAGNGGRGGQLISDQIKAGGTAPLAPPTPPQPVTTATIASLIEQPVQVFDLEQPRFQGMPVIAVHQPGYAYFLHRRHSDDYRPEQTGLRSGASGVIVCMEHSGTHIDAICHQAENQLLYGGIPAASVSGTKGFSKLAIEEVPPLLTPGVLLDAAAEKGVTALDAGHLVTAADLEACCRRQKVEVQPGDVVLIRTGNATYWHDPERFLAGPGMDSSASTWLAEQGVIAVGADNMAWDVIGLRDPTFNCQLPGHLILLARHGIHIIENMQLEQLAAAGVSCFTFICTPLKFVGATGSPVRPIAVVSGS